MKEMQSLLTKNAFSSRAGKIQVFCMCKCHAKGIKAVQGSLKKQGQNGDWNSDKVSTSRCFTFPGTSSAPRLSDKESTYLPFLTLWFHFFPLSPPREIYKNCRWLHQLNALAASMNLHFLSLLVFQREKHLFKILKSILKWNEVPYVKKRSYEKAQV